jgi:hypothetical protein
MPVNSFKFVSPGIFLNEIDNSQIPQLPGVLGPTIIGRSTKGRALHPIKVESFSDFVNEFGNPVAGGVDSDYRASVFSGPTYGAYAAQAYLAAGIGPINYVRLLGSSNFEATAPTGYAGWTTYDYSGATPSAKNYSGGGGALGLFVAASQSNGTHSTGTLAAVFYLTTGSLYLSGTLDGTATQDKATNKITKFTGDGASTDITVSVFRGGTSNEIKHKFNFNRDNNQFIRNVFHSNPVLTNQKVVDKNSLTKNEEVYWLGESYETEVERVLASSTGIVAWLAPVASGSLSATAPASYGEMRFAQSSVLYADSNVINGKTGWVFSQDLSSDTASYAYEKMTKLFRFHGLDAGEWTHKNIKISIDNVSTSPNSDVEPYGRFSVIVRDIRDTDGNMTVLERFDNLSLNPVSPDYIGVRIGDKTVKFDYAQRTNKEYGQYDNQSKFIRVELNAALESGLVSPAALPFGVYGPIRPARVLNITNATTAPNSFLGVGTYPGVDKNTVIASSSGGTAFTCSIVFPGTAQRVSASDGGISDPKRAFFGIRTSISADSSRFDSSLPDTLRLYGTLDTQNVGLAGLDASAPFEYQWIFSLDDVILPSNSAKAYYQSGSRAAGLSRTATSGGYSDILSAGFDGFTTVFQGGADGLNIQEAEPFQANRIVANNKTSYEFNTLEMAIDLTADPDLLETNLIVVPGVRKTSITNKLLNVCEARADAFAIIDIEDGYQATTETTESFKNRLGSVTTAVSNLRSRKINSSYGCAYYPWVQIRDSISNQLVWVPPSVVILGTMASSEKSTEVWFAPAGFNRGGLSNGAAGLPVVNVAEKLTSKQRDDLYAANINPIASFPAEGIVVFGQKTLQVTPSALDRINVRRLMIYIKKQVSRFATTVLFDQNVNVTWNRFKGLVEPFLASVQSRFGLTEYRLILDETTTTPDLVDRNILYAKVLLKPARSIEFIAVDFVISRTGASFED